MSIGNIISWHSKRTTGTPEKQKIENYMAEQLTIKKKTKNIKTLQERAVESVAKNKSNLS